MKIVKLFFSLLIILVIASYFSATSQASLLGPAYPAPGDNSFNATGFGSGEYGGLNYNYSGFNPSAYDELYWGLSEGAPVGASLQDNTLETEEIMSFSSSLSDFSNGKYEVWYSQYDRRRSVRFKIIIKNSSF